MTCSVVLLHFKRDRMETHRGEELRLVPLWVFVSEMGLAGKRGFASNHCWCSSLFDKIDLRGKRSVVFHPF